jgi:hypothetical protein
LAVTLKNLACLVKPVYEDLAPIVQRVSRPAEKVKTGDWRERRRKVSRKALEEKKRKVNEWRGIDETDWRRDGHPG